MEFLNKVELIGVVGRASIEQFNGIKSCRFSLCVSELGYDVRDSSIVQTTWFYCRAFEKSGVNLSKLDKGAKVHLVGRLCAQRFAGDDDAPRVSYVVNVQSLKYIDND